MAATYFTISGIAPPDVKRLPPSLRVGYWQIVVELGLKRKDLELSRGLNARGEPLPGVKAATRKHRKSSMTPSGKGDPSAPYLMPGRGLSRTRSLLAGKAHADYAEFYWRYDPWSGDQWGKILAHHARRGTAYDVVGLSRRGVAAVAREAAARWRRILAVGRGPDLAAPAAPRGPVPLVGRTDLTYATEGIGGTIEDARRAIAEGRSSGFLSPDEWRRHFTQSRPSVQPRPNIAPSVTKGKSNVILQHVWEARVRPTEQQRLDAAVDNLVAGIEAGLTTAQLRNLLGDLFERAVLAAIERGLVALTRADGRPALRVVR